MLHKIVSAATLIAIAIAVMASPCLAKQPIRTIGGTVTKVSDGDTLQVTDDQGTKVKIRLYGADAPETAKPNKPGQPGGEESFQALRSKVAGKYIQVQIMDIDQYKRAVGIVWVGNRPINLEMVADGWAWAYRQYLDRPYSSEFIKAEETARRAGKGIWRQGGNVQPPWEFRKQLKNGGQIGRQASFLEQILQ